MLDFQSLKRTSWNFYSGSQLTYGPNAVLALGGMIQRHEYRRVLLITDPVLDEVGAVRQVRKAIQPTSAELHVCSDGAVEPTTDLVEQTANLARDFEPDLIVALGGGSNMDLAKACSALLHSDCTAESLLGPDNVVGPITPLACLPTTAGTGSEVSHSAVLKNSATDKKAAILSQAIRPKFALVDPYMTISCPAQVTAESGIDALTHAIEACLATNFFQFTESIDSTLPYEGNNPLGDLYAEKAIQLIAQHLQTAVEEPEDLTARSGMSLAATLAGAAFSNCGVGLCHALEYPLGSISPQCSHGAGNGIVLPEVLRYLAEHRPAKVARIAACLHDDFARLPAVEAADAAVEFICDLRQAINIPARLSDVGIEESQLPELVETAFSLQRLIDLTPGPPTPADGLKILRACL